MGQYGCARRLLFWAAVQVRARGGFTLVEVVVALTLLLVASLAFAPLYVYISQKSQDNQARLAATSIAAGLVEEIRGLPYDQIGTVGGNPAGVIEPEKKVFINGIEALVRTRIFWVDDPSDNDSNGKDPIPYDYKRVRVTVSAPGLFTGRVVQVADIRTLAALEGEEEVFQGGNIRVTAVRGWNPGPGDIPPPAEGVRVDIVEGPDAPQTLWTGGDGKALFAALRAGKYVVRAEAGALGMMVRPGGEEQEVSVTEGATSEAVFEVETPCRIEAITLQGQGPPVTEGKIILTTPFKDKNRRPITRGGEFCKDDISEGRLSKSWIDEHIGDLWPVGVYGLTVKDVPGYQPYELDTSDVDPDTWNGQFTRPGQSKQVVVTLTPI